MSVEPWVSIRDAIDLLIDDMEQEPNPDLSPSERRRENLWSAQETLHAMFKFERIELGAEHLRTSSPDSGEFADRGRIDDIREYFGRFDFDWSTDGRSLKIIGGSQFIGEGIGIGVRPPPRPDIKAEATDIFLPREDLEWLLRRTSIGQKEHQDGSHVAATVNNVAAKILELADGQKPERCLKDEVRDHFFKMGKTVPEKSRWRPALKMASEQRPELFLSRGGSGDKSGK